MSNDRSAAEAAARLRAAWHRYHAARATTDASVIRLSAAAQRFMVVLQEGTDREIAEHPDLAEVNVMLDGYYDDSPSSAVTPEQ
ncbi:hypothetical protein G3I43_07170 [Streptomyces anulatus]|uniref:Uncharacterized protein n=1 Tax=Streptomyces anulatus TaxID=1892 RepID=A0A6G3SM38_STRAQ|nr:hypothetical protein [Streptomyces anulatus]NEB83959.1 hypothetical protein [Streptomyces anulatus]